MTPTHRLSAPLMFCLLPAVALWAAEEQRQVFVEEGGVVCIEAEHTASDLGLWKKHTDASFKDWVGGFLGEACLQFTGNNEASGPPTSVLVYHVQISNPGTYKLAIRGLEAPLDSGEGDKANDCYVRMVGQDEWRGKFTKHVLLGKSFEWSWNVRSEYAHHKFTIAEYELAAGVHALEVSGRSKNFFLDRIVLYKDVPAKEAQSDGRSPSKRQSSSAPTAMRPSAPAPGKAAAKDDGATGDQK